MIAETRHPHPHVDPRQPRQGAQPGTNPPVFVWKPVDKQAPFGLTVAKDADFREVVLDVPQLHEPMYLPYEAFSPGHYYWRWSAGGDHATAFNFEITPQAVTLVVPPAEEWLRRLPDRHPRIYIRPEQVKALRDSRFAERADLWETLQQAADALLPQPHEIAEPPFLADREHNYQMWFDVWYRVMWESRAFVQGAETLALAYLASGDERYARAACQRLASISHWNPEGSSHLSHNDEAHMSVIWHGAIACDWVWEHFTAAERAVVIDQFRRRGQITYDYMHGHGSYGVTRFDSHAGREIVFLALIGLVFHDHVPDARVWLEWLRPVLCGVWPIWAGDDGAWAEGLSYGLAYVTIMTMFATTMKHSVNVDLYRRPFWANHARWRRLCLPPYAEWFGFGDHSERWRSTWGANADLVELIDRETGANEAGGYVAAFREEAGKSAVSPERDVPTYMGQRYIVAPAASSTASVPENRMMHVFPAAGWVALRTEVAHAAHDIAMVFRSSPYGSISHSHANHNDFILHVGGRIMAMPSGYYDGYGSNHHTHWVWHTKSHNCLTLSDAPQIMRSHEARGAIVNPYEDDQLAYWEGNADAAYADRALRCRRHVVYLKPHHAFLMVDEFVAQPGIASGLQWNIHSWDRFQADAEARRFRLERGGSVLEGHFLYHDNAFFTLTEGWDPPPFRGKPSEQWFMQHNLRFTASGLVTARRLAVILCAGLPDVPVAPVRAEQHGDAEIAHIGDDLVAVNQGQGIIYRDIRSEALAIVRLDGKQYAIGDAGIALVR